MLTLTVFLVGWTAVNSFSGGRQSRGRHQSDGWNEYLSSFFFDTEATLKLTPSPRTGEQPTNLLRSEQGQLALSATNSAGALELQDAAKIPKLVHHTWKDYPPAGGFDKVYFNVSYFSFRKFFPPPEYTFMFHTDKDLEACIAQEFPQFLEEFQHLGQGHRSSQVEKSDAGRYCILWKYGGIYADLDYEATQNFYDHLPPGQVSLNGSPYTENADTKLQVQNALMASPARHPFWPLVFAQMSKTGSHSWDSITGTGPKMISKVADDNRDRVHVLPCTNFQKVNGCGDVKSFSDVYAVHWNVNSYADFVGVFNIKLRMEDNWKHFHPDIPLPAPPHEFDQFHPEWGTTKSQNLLLGVA
jgi:mannosyltransferase OCH1-like enzyme